MVASWLQAGDFNLCNYTVLGAKKGCGYRIAGIFRGVYISRILRKGPSLLTLKPRNLIIESGCGQLECSLLPCG